MASEPLEPQRMDEVPATRKPLKAPNEPVNGLAESGSADASASAPSPGLRSRRSIGTGPSGGPSAGEVAADPADSPPASEDEKLEADTLARLRDLTRILVRALKAKKMYPANNPLLQRILAELSIAMSETLEAVGDIRFTVQQYDLLFLGVSVYHNTNKKDSIAFRFSKDGVTELVLQHGLPSEELEDFLSVLARAMETTALEDDLVTMLWEQEFSHISYAYLAIEDLNEHAIDVVTSEDPASRQVAWPAAPEEEARPGAASTDDAEEEGGSGERADDWAQLIPDTHIPERCPNDFLHLTSTEVEALAEEIHREHSRNLHDLVLEILTEVTEDEASPEAFADLARAFGDLLVIVVQEADLVHGVQIAATLKTLSASRGHDPREFLPDPRDLTAQAVAALARHPEADVSSLPEFLVHLGPRAVDPICDLLTDVDLHSLHGLLQNALAELAKQDLEAVRSRIDDVSPPAARLIVQVLARVGTREADEALVSAASHPEARVRKEALIALAATPAARGRPSLLAALEDPDAQVRATALHALRETPGSGQDDARVFAETLLAILSGPLFAEQSAAERRAYFEALASVADASVMATLSAWIGRWQLGGGAQVQARRELAAWTLVRIGEPEALAILRRLGRSLFPAVRGACRRALEEVCDRAA